MGPMRRVTLVLMLALAASPAVAQTLETLVDKRAGALSCWQRVYDAAHLESHPDQQVTAMTFGLGYQPPDDTMAAEDGLFIFGLSAALRDGKRGVTSGGCWPDGGTVRCGVDCDGGGVEVSKRPDGRLLIDLEATGYIRMESECGSDGEQESFPLEPGLDDKQFVLSPVAAKVCKALVPSW